jgi:hypothetical protein
MFIEFSREDIRKAVQDSGVFRSRLASYDFQMPEKESAEQREDLFELRTSTEDFKVCRPYLGHSLVK